MNDLRTFDKARPESEPLRCLTTLQVCQPEVYLLEVKDPALVFYALSECTKSELILQLCPASALMVL